MSGTDWTPVHHEDAEPEPEPKPRAAKPKDDAKDEPALVLTFPPHMITGIWALSEALKENTEALREHTKELKAARAASDGET